MRLSRGINRTKKFVSPLRWGSNWHHVFCGAIIKTTKEMT